MKSDFSDLAEVIKWCKEHDEECQRIAQNAMARYKNLINISGQLNYLQLMLYGFASRMRSHQVLAASGTEETPTEDLQSSGIQNLLRSIGRGDWFDAGNLEYAKVQLDRFSNPPSKIPSSSPQKTDDIESMEDQSGGETNRL